MFPRWYSLDDAALKNIKHRKEVDNVIRDKQVVNTRIAHANYKKNLNDAYDLKTSLRAVRNQGSKIERRMDSELFYNSKMINLMERVKQSDFAENSRTTAAYLKQKQVTKDETRRLNEIVAANRLANPEKWEGLP